MSPALSALKMAGSKPPEHYPKELMDSVQAIDSCQDEKDRKAILVRFQTIVTILIDAKVVKVRKMKATDILPHPKNRGGAMLNGYNAHENGADIFHVGCNLKELHSSMCFELSPHQAERNFQIEKNEELVKASKGLLAELNGGESGSGHLAAFIVSHTAYQRC